MFGLGSACTLAAKITRDTGAIDSHLRNSLFSAPVRKATVILVEGAAKDSYAQLRAMAPERTK
jgi:hypothetical protein